MPLPPKTIEYIARLAQRRVVPVAQRVIRTIPYRSARGGVYIGKFASGELYNSIATEYIPISPTRGIVRVYAADHITYIEDGRPPHPGDDSKLIPIKGERGRKFRNWAAKKGRNPYAVRRNIQKYGIAPMPLSKKIAEAIVTDFAEVAARQALDSISAYVLSELSVIFRNK